jgi:hypothetical protein
MDKLDSPRRKNTEVLGSTSAGVEQAIQEAEPNFRIDALVWRQARESNDQVRLLLQRADVGDRRLDLRVGQLALVCRHLSFALGDYGVKDGIRGVDDGRILE